MDKIVDKVNPMEIEQFKQRFAELMELVPTDVEVDIEDENVTAAAIHNLLIDFEQCLMEYL